jgi:4-alpha-glucanotransferase
MCLSGMNVTFRIRFFTQPGQILRVTGDAPILGDNETVKSLRMHYLDAQFWSLDVEIPDSELIRCGSISYRYVLEQEGGDWIEEWDAHRVIEPTMHGQKSCLLIDTWNHAGDIHHVFQTSPFRKVLLQRLSSPAHAEFSDGRYSHRFIVRCPLLPEDEELCLTGSAVCMGNWAKDKAVAMHRIGDVWIAALDMWESERPSTYKYAVRDRKSGYILRYEEGENRVIDVNDHRLDGTVIFQDGAARFRYDTWKGVGIAIPVFSLRSEKGFGVGEFTDIRGLVDWACVTGIRMIQLLPVNDTTSTGTWIDSYPYSAISAFALHPLYLNLEQAAGTKYAHLLVDYAAERKRLNSLINVDYEAVMRYKLDKIRCMYDLASADVFNSPSYAAFYRDNEYWLAPYAVFCHLRDKYGTPFPRQWQKDGMYDPKMVADYCEPSSPFFPSIGLYLFTQYLLHQQLSEAHDYANSKGLILKGDIPIGVNRQGVEAWMEPDLFDLDMQAGAPPDDFAIRGQNWGFPTYRWPRMQEDGYVWWKKRFGQMSRYFDAFRIDHILGFFRIWSIPMDAVEGIMGRFVPALPVKPHELHERGIGVNVDRLIRPYITDVVLWEMFGPSLKNIQPYLILLEDGTYRLSEEVNTQRKVEALFKGDDPEVVAMRQGLFDLISNVLMFEEPASQGTSLHFRFNMSSTSSFRHLPASDRSHLQELYVDYFFRRQDHIWKREALRKLPALKRCTDMLICGEDLGLVPSCVPDVMNQLGILSMEVQRMPKDQGQEFFRPSKAPYLSVVTPSSHDMSTIRGWWQEDAEQRQRFFLHELGQYARPPKDCEPWIVRNIIRQHLQSPAQWSVFQFQDLIAMSGELRQENAEDERINDPSNPHHYWRYRMHITIEQLMTEDGFNDMLLGMISDGARKH